MDDTYFLVIEGMDGVGKTTLSKRLFEYFDGGKIYQNIESTEWDEVCALETHEPQEGLAGYEYLISGGQKYNLATIFSYLANRVEHCELLIKPFLFHNNIYSEGKKRMVICDRYYPSTYAYQSNIEFTFGYLDVLHEHILKPNLILWLQSEPLNIVERLKYHEGCHYDIERFRELNTKYRDCMLHLSNKGHVIVPIDAWKTPDGVFEQSINAIARWGPDWFAWRKEKFEPRNAKA